MARNGIAKLTEDDARAIFAVRYDAHYLTLARRYGISVTQLYRIWRRDDPTWRVVKGAA